MRALIGEPQFNPGDATLIYHYSGPEHRIFVEELESLAGRSAIRVVYLPGARRDNGSWLPAGFSGTDHEVLAELAPLVADSDIYLCGPLEWLAAARRAAHRAGARHHQIHSEEFAW